MSQEAREQVDVWVTHLPNGTITKIAFLEIKDEKLPAGAVVFRTKLTQWALHRPHQLRVQNGKVVCTPALVGL
jgi:hypothetical protein